MGFGPQSIGSMLQFIVKLQLILSSDGGILATETETQHKHGTLPPIEASIHRRTTTAANCLSGQQSFLFFISES